MSRNPDQGLVSVLAASGIYEGNDSQNQNDILDPNPGQIEQFQPQEAIALEDELQRRIDLARQETKHLYNQIDKVKSRAHDANLLDMTRNVSPLRTEKINLTPTLVLKGHNNKVSDFRWSSDSRNILSASQDGFMLIWDTDTGLKKNAIPLDSQWVLTCAISPSGNLVASAGLNNNCTIYRVPRDSKVQQSVVSIFKGHTGYISDTAFTDNAHVVTASGDMTCAYWDIPKAKRVREYADHLGDVLAMSLPPPNTNSNVFASCGSDGYAFVWDTRSTNVAQTFFISDSDVNTIQFFNDGNLIVTGSDDGLIRMLDLRSDCPIATYSLANSMRRTKIEPTFTTNISSPTKQNYRGSLSRGTSHKSVISPSYLDNQGVTSLDFSGSGRLMYSCYTDFGCVVWDLLKAEIVGKLEGHSNRESGVRASPDGLAVCTGSWDSTMKLWSPSYV